MPYVYITAWAPMNIRPTVQSLLRTAARSPLKTAASKITEPIAGAKTAVSKEGQPLSLATAQSPVSPHSISQHSISPHPVSQHYAILQMGVTIWNQWRCEESLVIPNLRNADLSGMALENINLSRADLRGAKLDNAYLYDADFYKADLRGASLVRAGLVGASFYLANLSRANLERAYLNYSDLSSANFTGASLKATNLQDALLTKATLANAQLSAAEMSSSQDLTVEQFKSAKDSHLAFVSDELQQLVASFSDTPSLQAALDTDPKGSAPKDSAWNNSDTSSALPTAESANIESSRMTPSIEIAYRARLTV